MTPDADRFIALATASVRERDLQELFRSRNLPWDDACHVSATSSLCHALDRARLKAIPIASLIDLLVYSRATAGRPIDLGQYPASTAGQPDSSEHKDAIKIWGGLISGLRLQTSVRFDETLRRVDEADGTDARLMSVLLHGRRDLQRVLQSLIAAGFKPCDDDVKPASELGRVALRVWGQAEVCIPSLSWIRDDLWSGDAKIRADVLSHLKAVLKHTFGQRDRWTLVYHGFYFFTPPQWALFQLLREAEFVNQVFVVHDNGSSPMYETWRRFFNEALEMPTPSLNVHRSPTATAAGAALEAALAGRRIDGGATTDSLRILECPTVADLVSEFTRARTAANQGQTDHGDDSNQRGRRPSLYAAQHAEIARIWDRLAPDQTDGMDARLAQLPIGAFLLRLHECIQPGGSPGSWSLVLTEETVRDLVHSGFVLSKQSPHWHEAPRAMRQALPFFRGCKHASEWLERARQLERMVIDHVARFGIRDEHSETAGRIASAVANPLRLVPWGDLSLTQAKTVRVIFEAIVTALEQIASNKRVNLKDIGARLRNHLEAGLESIPARERAVLEAKLDGLESSGLTTGDDDDIHVVGLIDIVQILLGQGASFDEHEMGNESSPHEGTDRSIAMLRGLDVLGFTASEEDIHIANLSDGAFPSVVPAVGWPFTREDLVGEERLRHSRRILEARSDYAALSDLYLLWLSLNGVCEGKRVTLSWISDQGGATQSLSGIIGLLVTPDQRRFEEVAQRVGGLSIDRAQAGTEVAADLTVVSPAEPKAEEKDVQATLATLKQEAVAASIACPRRFALQWLLGPSPAFQPGFLQNMLCGNTVGAMVRGLRVDEAQARSIVSDFWRHLTHGERASSFAKCVIHPTHGAKPQWRFSLFGSLKPERDTPLDRAYQCATNTPAQPPDGLAQDQVRGLLPTGASSPHAAKCCLHCPVQARCKERVDPLER